MKKEPKGSNRLKQVSNGIRLQLTNGSRLLMDLEKRQTKFYQRYTKNQI